MFLSTIAFLLPASIMSFALYTNKDYFSPSKWFVAFITLFHFELIFVDYQLEFHLTYYCYLVIALFFIICESKFNTASLPYQKIYLGDDYDIASKLVYLIWLLSLIPILSQIFFILQSGGIVQYTIDMIYKSEVWRGKGPLLIAIQMMQILNVIYFAIGIYLRKRLKKWWFVFFIHMVASLTLGLLTGSRSIVLMNFVTMGVLDHFIRRPLALKFIVSSGLILLMAVTVLGLARNNFKWDDDGITTGLSSSNPFQKKISTSTSSFRLGLIPLSLVYSKETPKLQHGTSLITPFTNVVPRDMWPNKPDTASIAMNKQYVEDRGLGPYEYPTGLIGLGIMNFGWFIGIVFGFFLLTLFYIITHYSYTKYIINYKHRDGFSSVLLLIVCLYVIQTLPALVVGEITNVLHGVMLTKILPILSFIFVLWLSKPVKTDNL